MKHKFILIGLLLSLISMSCHSQDKVNPCSDCNLTDTSGKKYGLWIEDNGLREVYYNNGLRHGVYRSYSRKGKKLSAFGQFTTGAKSGTWYYFDETSKIIMVERDIQSNKIEVKRDDGKTIVPKFRSFVSFYHPNGSVREEGLALYNEDIEIDFFKSGLWKKFDEKGKVTESKTH
jgi:antitoxin component YwqK of YwqJK toxin-antitoxin module